ncbi:MAG TPA: P-type conjugative transfer protein TrbL [Nitrosospira sp.]|nr:P-type conjugative transfer protein TrbL [Nitrosospira sp.]
MIRTVLALFFLCAGPAMAAGTLDPATASDGLLALMRSSANSWSGVLRGYATDIFWTLALIQFVWKFGMLALRKTDFSELAAELVRWCVIIGIYASLLLYSVVWTQAIVDSFRQAGASAAGTSAVLQPGDLFALAVELGRMVASVGLTDPVTAFIVALSAILIVMCFTFLAAFLMVTLIESYFVINAGVFFMAFGGSEWTREYAMAMLRYAVSVGAKLFVLQLIVGIIMSSARTLQAAYTHDETSMLTMTGVAFICAVFSKTLAETVQGLISGVSVGGGATLGGMAAAGLAGVAAGAAAMSATMGSMSLGGAGKSVSELIKSSVSGSGSSGGGGSASSFMNSGGGSGSGSNRSASASPRTGGGGYSQAPSAPPSSQSTESSKSSSNGSSVETVTPKSAGERMHAGAHMAAEAAVRSVGVMGSLAVPGMESSSGASIGPPPTPPDLPDVSGETPENVIRPDSDQPGAPPEANKMADLQESLNNKGKTS